MYDFDDDEIVVSGAGGSTYITVGPARGFTGSGKSRRPRTLEEAQDHKRKERESAKKAVKDKAKKQAAPGKKQAGTRDKRKSDAANRPVPKDKRTPRTRG